MTFQGTVRTQPTVFGRVELVYCSRVAIEWSRLGFVLSHGIVGEVFRRAIRQPFAFGPVFGDRSPASTSTADWQCSSDELLRFAHRSLSALRVRSPQTLSAPLQLCLKSS